MNLPHVKSYGINFGTYQKVDQPALRFRKQIITKVTIEVEINLKEKCKGSIRKYFNQPEIYDKYTIIFMN